jgi:hypothetical protein
MADRLRATAGRMLDLGATTDNLNLVLEVIREGVVQAADVAPFTFESPADPTNDPAALAAQIGRM